jgi:hypothetical protein
MSATITEEQVKARMDQWLASKQLDDIGSYLQRGRRFGTWREDELLTVYKLAIILVCGLVQWDQRELLWDVEAEYRLRKLPIPDNLIDPFLPHFRAKVLPCSKTLNGVRNSKRTSPGASTSWRHQGTDERRGSRMAANHAQR